MAFNIDTATPANSQIIASYPASARAHKVQVENIITAEHDEATGLHMISSGDKDDRDAVAAPVEGEIWLRDDIPVIDSYLSAAWGSHPGYGYGTAAGRAALTPGDMPNGYAFFESDTLKTYVYDTTEVDWVEMLSHPTIDVATAAPDGMYDSQFSTTSTPFGSGSWDVLQDGGADMEGEVTIPDEGDWLIRGSLEISLKRTSTSGITAAVARLRQSIDGAAATTVKNVRTALYSNNLEDSLSLDWIVPNPGVGEVYTYTIEGRRAGTTDYVFNGGATVDGEAATTYLDVLVEPAG